MNIEKTWQELNKEDPSPELLKDLLKISGDSQKLFFAKFCQELSAEDCDGENEWSIIHWVRYAEIFQPEDYVRPILNAVKKMVQTEISEDYEDTYIYNSLTCFLEEFIGLEHEILLLEEWDKAEDADWKEELLTYLAKAQTKNPVIIDKLVNEWDEDLFKASSFLYDYPHPKLIEVADSHIEFMAPWYKYIWSKGDYSSLDMMDWIEVISAWAKAKFPEEEKHFDFKMTPLESIQNWINIKSNNKPSDDHFIRLNDEYVKWREAKIERYFLSSLPEDWKDWLLSPHLSPELRTDFQQELTEAGLFKFGSVTKNGPCPCGSGRKAKRCCYKE